MESDLLKAIVGLKLAAQSEDRSNIHSAFSSLRNDNIISSLVVDECNRETDDNGSITIDESEDLCRSFIVDECNHETDDNDSLTIDESQDLCRSFFRSVKKPKNHRLPLRETEAQAVFAKKPKLDDSKNKENERLTVLRGWEENKLARETSTALLPVSINRQPKIRATSCSKQLSIIADSGFDESKGSHSEKTKRTRNTKSSAAKNLEENLANCSNKEKSRQKHNDGLAAALQSTDNQQETQMSSCSTYYSDGEDNRVETSTQLGRTPPKHQNTAECPAAKANETFTRISTLNVEPLFSISLLLGTLEKEQLTLEYMRRLSWQDTLAEEAVEAFVLLAESTRAKEGADLCRNAAIDSIGRAYARYSNASKSCVLNTDSHWNIYFAIFFTLCNSSNICQEFLTLFTSYLRTPRSVKDLEDPDEIINVCVEHDEAHFVLTRLHYLLKRYAKTTKEKKCKTIQSVGSQQAPELWCCYDQDTAVLWVHLLYKFGEYAAKNCFNFPTLASIASRNLTLVKRKLPLEPLV